MKKCQFIGLETCIKDMFESFTDFEKTHVLIAHNAAKFDSYFLVRYLKNANPIMKGNTIIAYSGQYYNEAYGKVVNIEIKDSYKMISLPLSKFAKTFGLKVGKDIMPYELYTEDDVQTRYIDNEVFMSYVKECDQKQCKENIIKWKCLTKDGKVDIIKYNSEYCKIDVDVLHDGYETFRKWMKQITKIDINDKLTLQSVAFDYIEKQKCLDGVYKLSGVVQQFIAKCIVGGRCMTRNNNMYCVKKKLNDFDAVNLYSSAMREMLGFLKGKPNILQDDQLNQDFLKGVDGYFIQIKIKRVGIKRSFSLMSKVNDEGVRDFINEMENDIIYIDKTGLEDLITFQDVDFEIIRGYYFNEGRNSTIRDVIKELFDERAEMKRKGNPAETVIKLLMKSIYGKLIMRPIEYETKVFDNDEKYDKYADRNYNYIHSKIKIGTKHHVKVHKSLLEHYNYIHCGVEILSMSKRIMNRVMCLAEDNNINIYYQDTDSMHIQDDKIMLLEKLFKEKYGRNLIGKELGEFHCDFDLKGSVTEPYNKLGYFLGKKTYLDCLEGLDKNNDIINGNHTRAKGLTHGSIIHEVRKQLAKSGNYEPSNEEIQEGEIEVYKRLFNGEGIIFDLTEDGNKTIMKRNPNLTLETHGPGDFTRKLCFKNKKRIVVEEDGYEYEI